MSEVEDRLDCFLHPGHEGRSQFGQWTADEAAIVDGPELIDEKVGATTKSTGHGDADTQRLGIFGQVRGERDDEGRGMADVKQRLGLDNQHGTGFAGLGSAVGIEIGEPDFAAFRRPGHARWRRIAARPAGMEKRCQEPFSDLMGIAL